MKGFRSTVMIVLCVLATSVCLGSIVVAQERSIYISDVGGGYFYDLCKGPCLTPGEEAEFYIHMTNNGAPECYFLPSMSFVIHDNGSGATWDWPSTEAVDALFGYELLFVDQYCPTPQTCVDDTVYFDRGGQPYGDGGHRLFSLIFREFFSGNGTGADTISFAGLNAEPLGVYEGLDADVLALKFTPNINGTTICIDTAGSVPSYEWAWTAFAVDGGTPCTAGIIAPEWGGPYCYTVSNPDPTGYPAWDITSTAISGDHCKTLTAQFSVSDPPSPDPGCGPSPDIVYSVVSGPGEIDPVTGIWTWSGASPDDVGELIYVTVGACYEGCCDCGYAATPARITVTEPEVLRFVGGCDAYMTNGVGGEAYPFEIRTAGGCHDGDLSMSAWQPTGFLGLYWWQHDSLYVSPDDLCDPGLYVFPIEATDGLESIYCTVTLSVIQCPMTCCGVYASNRTGNTNAGSDGQITLSDITMLIDRVFISRAPLWCEESGNVNGDPEGAITLSDITRLIDHVYISKEPTEYCPACAP